MDWRTFYDLLSEWPFKIKLGFHSVAETFFKEKEKKNDNNNIIFRRSKAHLKIQLQRDVHNIYYFYLSHAKKVHNFCLVKFPLIYIYTTYTTILYYYWFNLMHFILHYYYYYYLSILDLWHLDVTDSYEHTQILTHSSYIYWAFKLSLSILPFLSLLHRYTHSILHTKIIVGTFAFWKPYFRYIRIIRSGCPVPSTSSYMIPTQMQHSKFTKDFCLLL